MLRPLRVIWVTAVTEWKILLRQRTFWLLAGLLFLIGWISFDHNTLNITSAISLAHSIATGTFPVWQPPRGHPGRAALLAGIPFGL